MIRKELGDLIGVIERRQEQARKFPYDLVYDAQAWSKIQVGDPWGIGVVAIASRVLRGKK
jgi:hypothetical protein